MYLGVPNPNILVPLEKMTISAEIEGKKETIEVLYNPESYSQSREVRYAQSQGIATNTPLVQYTGGGSEILQFKLCSLTACPRAARWAAARFRS